MKRLVILFPATLAVLVLLTRTAMVEGCGPYQTMAGFVMTEEPDSVPRFVGGDLQIVQEKFRKKYLFVAYRYLSGKPLSEEEVKRLDEDFAEQRADESAPAGVETASDSVTAWQKARAQVPGTTTKAVDQDQALTKWTYYVNCLDPAFDNATQTLGDRIRKFGAKSREVSLWLQGQDQVFANCGGTASIPQSLGTDVAPIVRADREYQIGAALFYSRNWDQARAQFRKVAADSSSPWRQIAPFVAARALVRKATMQSGGNDPYDPGILAVAEAELKAILRDKNLAAVHGYAEQILTFVEFRLHPDERRAVLESELSQGRERPRDIVQDLTDYLMLPPASTGKSTSDMTAWITHMSSLGDSLHYPSTRPLQSVALQRWREHRQLHWLVAALAGAKDNDTDVQELLAAARAVPENSSAYLTVHYHQLRLLSLGDDKAEAYAGAASLIDKMGEHLSGSSRNALLEIRLRAAPSFDAFVQNLPRRPVYEAYGEDIAPCRTGKWPSLEELCGAWLLDHTGAELINTLPVAVLAKVAQSKSIPASLKADLLKAAWTRAVLLGDHEVGLSIAPDLSVAIPASAALLKPYIAATDDKAREEAAWFVMVHLPGLEPELAPGQKRQTAIDRIDDLRNNWWCAGARRSDFWSQDGHAEWGRPARDSAKAPQPRIAAFLSASEREQAQTEAEKLRAIPSAPNYLSKSVLQWAEESPDDKRLPEALHFAVRSSRFGCTDKDTKTLSKAAFDLLHKRFPQSRWAAETPYYFK